MIRLLVVVLLLGLALPARAQERVALVIGNGAYRTEAALPNAGRDARDVAARLAALGFSVTERHDLAQAEMMRALRDFARVASGAEDALIYFAGHGMEMGGENYLLPVDVELRSDRDLAFEAITLAQLQEAVAGATGLRLIMLDACRNNPFGARMARTDPTRSITRGLARVEPAGGLLIAYAARAGEVASDGSGRNSPFTTALLEALEEPGLEVNRLFRRIRDRVLAATGGQQEPITYGALPDRDLFLNPPGAVPAPPADRPAWAQTADALPFPDPQTTPAVSADGRLVAYARSPTPYDNPTRELVVWSVDDGAPRFSVVVPSEPVYEIGFSYSGALVHAVIGERAFVIGVAERRVLFEVDAPMEGMSGEHPATAAFSPDDRIFVLGTAAAEYQFVPIARLEQAIWAESDSHYAPRRIWWTESPDAMVADAGPFTLILLLDREFEDAAQELDDPYAEGFVDGGFGPYERMLDVAPSGRAFATLGDDGDVAIWDMPAYAEAVAQRLYIDERPLPRRVSHPQVRLAGFDPAGRVLATASADLVLVWDVRTGAVIARITRQALRARARSHMGAISGVTLIDDGRMVLVQAGQTLLAVDVASVEVVQEFPHAEPWAISRDARTLILGGGQLWRR